MKTMPAILCWMLFTHSLAPGQQPLSASGALVREAMNAASDGDPIGRAFYRYGYYLFLAGAPHGCEDCYVPLLITARPLEQIARGQTKVEGVWIITYERDSIWQVDGKVDLDPSAIEAPAQKIRVKRHTYRYQQAPADDVLKLLQHPLGNIPISRPFMVNIIVPGASLNELATDFRTLFRVRERSDGRDSVITGSATTRMSSSGFTSLLTVLDDGTAEYRVVPDCFDRLLWSCSHSASERVFPYALTPPQLSDLKALIERPEVKQVSDFMNAAPTFDDYDVDIPHSDNVQHIQILAWMPSHIELQQHPALLYLVCKAKEIEHLASGPQEIPDWCKSLPPLK
jgi:hypothetical protein